MPKQSPKRAPAQRPPERDSGENGTRHVRLIDVAELAHVSVATASRALSGEPMISTKTRRRVEAAATRLSYRVNPVARALSLRRSATVGLVIGDLTNPFFAQLARGIDAGLRTAGYAYMLADLAGDVSREAELVAHLVDRRVDGLLVTAPHDLEVLREVDIPIVAIDRCEGLPYVSGDNREGGRLAGAHLISRGYRRPGVLYASPELPNVEGRRSGFAEALRVAGVAADPQREVCCASLVYDDAYVGALALLQRDVDAIFAIDDVMAAAAIAAVLELGKSVPEDVGVVGYDDTMMASWRTLSLTSVDQRTVELGRAAADMILRRIQEPEAEIPSVTLSPRLVARGSSAGPRGRTTAAATTRT